MTKPAKPRAGRPTGVTALPGHRTKAGLTMGQEAFCRGRATGMTIEEAWRVSGAMVSLSTAQGWERKSEAVRDRINELSKMATDNAILKTGLTREWVISRLMTVVERCMQAEPVTDKKGEPTGEYLFDATGANQALRMLGDTMGLFKPAEKKPEDDYANLSDDDLARIAAELAAQTGIAAYLAGTQAAAGSQQVIEVQAVLKAD